MIIEAWHKLEDFPKGFANVRKYDDGKLKIRREVTTELANKELTINSNYDLKEGINEEIVKETQKIRIFTKDKFINLMSEANLTPYYVEKGFGEKELFLGVKN